MSPILDELLTEELRLLTILEHPHIVRALGLCEDEETVYVAFELMKKGTLTEIMRKIKQHNIDFTEADSANIIHQILLALSYLHSPDINVIHRDLKLDNIMVEIEKNAEGHSKIICKVTDFGFAVAMDPSGKKTLSLGTAWYMAPELCQRKSYDNSVDIWALGVILHTILTEMPAFGDPRGTKPKMYKSIINDELNLKPFDRFYKDGKLVKDFIMKCLDKDPEKRLSANELLNHPWIKTMVLEEDVEEKKTHIIAKRLDKFKDATLFQKSVITFLVRLKSDKENEAALRKIFTCYDSDHDGFLVPDEILKAMSSLDSSKSGLEDFKELDWK